MNAFTAVVYWERVGKCSPWVSWLNVITGVTPALRAALTQFFAPFKADLFLITAASQITRRRAVRMLIFRNRGSENIVVLLSLMPTVTAPAVAGAAPASAPRIISGNSGRASRLSMRNMASLRIRTRPPAGHRACGQSSAIYPEWIVSSGRGADIADR